MHEGERRGRDAHGYRETGERQRDEERLTTKDPHAVSNVIPDIPEPVGLSRTIARTR
jgi:hypothetical protein